MITCPRCAGDGYLDYTCKSCNGSGEGLDDGTRCGVCPKSEGVIRDTCDVCKGKCKVLAPLFKIELSLMPLDNERKNSLEIEEIEENELYLSIVHADEYIESAFEITIDEFLEAAEKIKNMREE